MASPDPRTSTAEKEIGMTLRDEQCDKCVRTEENCGCRGCDGTKRRSHKQDGLCGGCDPSRQGQCPEFAPKD